MLKFSVELSTPSSDIIKIDVVKQRKTLQAGIDQVNSRYVWVTDIECNQPPPAGFEIHVLKKNIRNHFRVSSYKNCERVEYAPSLVATNQPDEWQKIMAPFSSFLSLTRSMHWDESGFKCVLFTVAQTPNEIEELLSFLEQITKN